MFCLLWCWVDLNEFRPYSVGLYGTVSLNLIKMSNQIKNRRVLWGGLLGEDIEALVQKVDKIVLGVVVHPHKERFQLYEALYSVELKAIPL